MQHGTDPCAFSRILSLARRKGRWLQQPEPNVRGGRTEVRRRDYERILF
jgi:hypothetical protein